MGYFLQEEAFSLSDRYHLRLSSLPLPFFLSPTFLRSLSVTFSLTHLPAFAMETTERKEDVCPVGELLTVATTFVLWIAFPRLLCYLGS